MKSISNALDDIRQALLDDFEGKDFHTDKFHLWIKDHFSYTKSSVIANILKILHHEKSLIMFDFMWWRIDKPQMLVNMGKAQLEEQTSLREAVE